MSFIICSVAAGYALYGSATMIVLSLGKTAVNGFMYDPVSTLLMLSIKHTK